MAHENPPHALAQYVVTGTYHGRFDASGNTRQAIASVLAQANSPELVAKSAIYARTHGATPELPAFLLAHLAVRDVALMSRVFPRVIDDGRMLRAFVEIVRCGITGRKSFGSAPKRALREWFSSRSPEVIFRQSIGQSPSMSDVIKMIRPPPRNDQGEADAIREALYGYLIGKNIERDRLPALARALEAWKHRDGPLPDVPFEMLCPYLLSPEEWQTLAERMTIPQLRMNLNTLLRQGVFDADDSVASVVARLTDRDALRRTRPMPYQLFADHRHSDARMPSTIVNALARALEHTVSGIPEIEGRVVVCPDVSASMHSSLVGQRGLATTLVRCIDIAALVSAAVLRRNPGATVLPFSDDVVILDRPLEPFDPILAIIGRLTSLPGGGTSCSAPLRWLNARGEAPDVVVMISDNESCSNFIVMAEEWQRLRSRTPKAKLVLIDLQPQRSAQMAGDDGDDAVLRVSGFSDSVFDVLATFARGDLTNGSWLHAIEAISLA